jgi:hypothetical protein
MKPRGIRSRARRLQLSKETVRHLSMARLGAVVGAMKTNTDHTAGPSGCNTECIGTCPPQCWGTIGCNTFRYGDCDTNFECRL